MRSFSVIESGISAYTNEPYLELEPYPTPGDYLYNPSYGILQVAWIQRTGEVYFENKQDIIQTVRRGSAFMGYSYDEVTVEEKEIRKEISHSSRTIRDTSKYEDYISETPGKNGYQIVIQKTIKLPNGATDTQEINGERVEPQDKIITKGTKPIHTTSYRYEEKPADEIIEQTVFDKNIYVGKKEVVEGVPDTLRLTYLRHYEKGVFRREEFLRTDTISPGRPRIIKIGTKKYPYLWRRLKVIRTTGEVEYTGYELVNSYTKDIQKLDSYFKGYQELTDKEFKRTLEKIENQNSIIDSKFSETRTSINELKETSESAIRNITSTVENKLSGYTSDINTRFEQMNNRFSLYVTESTYNKDKSSYESKFSSIEQKSNRIELSIAGKTDSSDVKNIFTSLKLTDKQIKSVTDKFTIESRSGTYRNEMKWGNFTSYKDGYKQFEVNQRGLEMFEGGERIMQLSTTYWKDNKSRLFHFSHSNSSMMISFLNAEKQVYNPYITFDKYNTSGTLASSNYPIKINEKVEMANDFWIKPGMDLWIGNTFKIFSSKLGGDDILCITTGSGKHGIAISWNKVYTIRSNNYQAIH